MEENIEQKSMKKQIDDIAKAIVPEEKKKKWKLPNRGKVSKFNARKGWTGVILLRSNRQLDFMKVPTDEQTTLIDGTPRITTANDTFYYKGKPVIIQPEWSAKPFSIVENQDQTFKDNYNAIGYKLLLNKMKKEVIMAKKTMSGWAIFIAIVVMIIAGYFAFQGGLFK